MAGSDPEAAAQWAVSIGNETMRNSQVESILGNWLKNNPAGATAWINTSPLPDEMKTKLLSQQK